jgi:predicted transcriptional regulator
MQNTKIKSYLGGVKTVSTPATQETVSGAAWTFLTNHSHVLICLARDPASRLRDVALLVGITERAVQRIVADLEEAGIIARTRDGRRNHYEVHRSLPLRHAVEAGCTVGDLLSMMPDSVPS